MAFDLGARVACDGAFGTVAARAEAGGEATLRIAYDRGGEGYWPEEAVIALADYLATPLPAAKIAELLAQKRAEISAAAQAQIANLLGVFAAQNGLPDTMTEAQIGDHTNSLAIFIANADRIFAASNPPELSDPTYDLPRWALLTLQQGIASARAREAADLAAVQALADAGDGHGLAGFEGTNAV